MKMTYFTKQNLDRLFRQAASEAAEDGDFVQVRTGREPREESIALMHGVTDEPLSVRDSATNSLPDVNHSELR